MAARSQTLRKAIGRAGNATRWGTITQAAEARREVRALKLAEHVERVVREFPPLTDEQCNRIAALLRRPQGTDGGQAA
ncbi:hypothetical protein [Pseudonocardia sp. H11422]|uniref:hypothetical protein n=1 Tax=Pseudonocardia sp. H11422 TaxID=2835866 RepID=UPI001BDD3542|nr:hypothetical protein [Pseudonocardia sp. H11422]